MMKTLVIVVATVLAAFAAFWFVRKKTGADCPV
jgi:hypothetical protein